MPLYHGSGRGGGAVDEYGQHGFEQPEYIIRGPVMAPVNTDRLVVIPHFSVLHSLLLL